MTRETLRRDLIPSIIALVALGALAVVAGVQMTRADIPEHVTHADLKERIAKYAQVDISYDESVLSESEKEALKKLVHAARVMDAIFLNQVSADNIELGQKLEGAMSAGGENGPLANDLWHFWKLNFGPWDRLDEDKPFIGGKSKPAGAGYYPEDLTKEEFEAHIAANPGDAEAFRDYFTKIERREGKLVAVPYNQVYQEQLAQAAVLLNEAADALLEADASKSGSNYQTLATYLRSRADAFVSNDYFQSDMDWMDVENNIVDVTIGPYEVYEDGLFAFKAAFEAFIAIRHPEDSKKLKGLKDYLPAMEMNLPIPDKHKNQDRGSDSPISVVDLVFAGGDTKAGVQTIAFNLPNDERVREAKGSKKVMLKNISRAKYDKILVPIADALLDKAQRPSVNFSSYFTNVLMHELAHGLGPGNITLADGTETTVNRALQTLYSPLEECKADIMGLYNKSFLVKKGEITKEELEKSYICFLPGFFRAIRFGHTSAHGKANMMEYNFLKEKGAIVLDAETRRYTVILDKMPEAVEAMTHELCMIQALGDYDRAQAFIERYGEMPDEVALQLKELKSIPTDIEPKYATAGHLQ